MRLNLNISKKGLLLVIVPLVFELLFVGSLFKLLQNAESQIKVERQLKNVLASSNKLTVTFYRAGEEGVMLRLRDDPAKQDKFQSSMNEIDDLMSTIDRNVRSLPDEDQSLPLWEEVKKTAGVGREELLTFMAKSELNFRRIFNRDIQKKLNNYASAMDAFVGAEERIDEQRSLEMQSASDTISHWLFFGVALNVVLGIALANYFSVGTVKRLHTLMDNTFRIAARKELNPPVGGGDEIAHLDTVFHQMAKDLEDAARRKQEMVAMVTHDLRTPLMSMQAVLELLAEGVMGQLPEKAKHEVAVAQFSAERLIQLINDLLDIDKLEAGKFELSKRESDPGWIFERCLRAVKAFADRNQVKITVPDDDEDISVYGDPDRLAQVVTNLLSNAIKFSPQGAEINMLYKDLPDATLFQIVDRGRGVPFGYEQKIFERFQQVDASDPREKKGSGLGLAICKALIEAHSGTIGVQSNKGPGSTFWFKVPKHHAARTTTDSLANERSKV